MTEGFRIIKVGLHKLGCASEKCERGKGKFEPSEFNVCVMKDHAMSYLQSNRV
jgi:hypothetical protein